jgi:predicted AAA+ superfamily ATPase
VSANPDAALRRAQEPLLLDEWQEVPEVLGAVKRAVDDHPRPARFILTGSVEADLTRRMWPGTGRVVRLVLDGLTQREVVEEVSGPGLLARVIEGDLDSFQLPADVPDIDGHIELALRSGFPEPALRLTAASRQAWLDAYLDHVVTRDVRLSGHARDPVRLRRYLEVLGLSTAGLPTAATLYDAAGIDKRTASAYDGLLESLHLLDQVPAWSTNRLARLTTRAKLPDGRPRDRGERGAHRRRRSCATATCWGDFSTRSSQRSYARSSRSLPGSCCTTSAPNPAARRSTSSSTWEAAESSGSRSRRPPPQSSRTPAT